MTKTKQFSNEFDVIYSRENNLWFGGVDWEKCTTWKLKVRVYLACVLRTSSQGHRSLRSLWGTALKSQNVWEFLQQRAGSQNIKRLLIIKENQTSQVNEISPFLCIGKGKEGEVAQSCLILCDPMDHNLLGSSVHGIFQARVLECVAITFSTGPSWPSDRIQLSCIAGRRFTIWATREAQATF